MLDAANFEISTGGSFPAQTASESEAHLSKEIVALWSRHMDNKTVVRRTKEELKNLRRKLGEKLWQMKSLLAHSGRGGQWTSYLRDHNLPRTSADRLVRQQEAMLNPQPTNRPSGAISEPTEADIRKFVERLLPRLQHMLTTREATFQFLSELVAQLPVTDACVTAWGIEIYNPAQEEPALEAQEKDIPQPQMTAS